MVSYIAQARQSMATAGNNISFGGGEMWSARPHSPTVPSPGQHGMLYMRSTCAHDPYPFPCSACALVTCSGM
jgi:hypothetical protein